MSSFHIDDRIEIKMEVELCTRLGEFIVNSGTPDKQIMALGHRLMSLVENEEEPRTRWIPSPSRQFRHQEDSSFFEESDEVNKDFRPLRDVRRATNVRGIRHEG